MYRLKYTGNALNLFSHPHQYVLFPLEFWHMNFEELSYGKAEIDPILSSFCREHSDLPLAQCFFPNAVFFIDFFPSVTSIAQNRTIKIC